MVWERGRLMSYLEQSTRYVPYTDRPGGRYKYHVPEELRGTPLEARYVETLDLELILADAREGNAARAVTGVLVYSDGVFLQILEGEEAVYELEARPNYQDTGYSKLVLTVNRDNFRTSRIEFYDKSGQRLKTLTASKWKVYHGRFHRPLELDMRNHQTGKRTVIEASAYFVNLSLYPRRDGSSRSNLTDEQVESAAIICESGNELLGLINEILDFSKIETGREDLEQETGQECRSVAATG